MSHGIPSGRKLSLNLELKYSYIKPYKTKMWQKAVNLNIDCIQVECGTQIFKTLSEQNGCLNLEMMINHSQQITKSQIILTESGEMAFKY